MNISVGLGWVYFFHPRFFEFSLSLFSRLLGIYLVLGPVRVVSASGSVVVKMARKGLEGSWPPMVVSLGCLHVPVSFILSSPFVRLFRDTRDRAGSNRVVSPLFVSTRFGFSVDAACVRCDPFAQCFFLGVISINRGQRSGQEVVILTLGLGPGQGTDGGLDLAK